MKQKVVLIELPDYEMQKLEEYGFDWKQNLQDWAEDVAMEIIRCENKGE